MVKKQKGSDKGIRKATDKATYHCGQLEFNPMREIQRNGLDGLQKLCCLIFFPPEQ